MRATFLGVSTILFSNGVESILIDGFFTRPSVLSTLMSRIGPSRERIKTSMDRAAINDTLLAVLVAHSHYDHVLDSPIVCLETGAKLVGSDSTRNVGLGYGLGEDQIEVVKDGEKKTYGNFTVTFYTGLHSPGDKAPGEITLPVVPPTSYKNFKTGLCYSFLIEHVDSQPVFVHPSANYLEDKFNEMHVHTMFLGVGVLGKQSDEFRKQYWAHVVKPLNPTLVIPIHWDNFWTSLEKPLQPMPSIVDRWNVTDSWLKQECSAANIELRKLQAWEAVDVPSD